MPHQKAWLLIQETLTLSTLNRLTHEHSPFICYPFTEQLFYNFHVTRMLSMGSTNWTLKIPRQRAFIYSTDVSDTVKPYRRRNRLKLPHTWHLLPSDGDFPLDTYCLGDFMWILFPCSLHMKLVALLTSYNTCCLGDNHMTLVALLTSHDTCCLVDFTWLLLPWWLHRTLVALLTSPDSCCLAYFPW